MPIGGQPEYEPKRDPLDELVRRSGLSREFIVWYLNYLDKAGWPDATAQGFWNAFPDEKTALERIKSARKQLDKEFTSWQHERAAQKPTTGEAAEARAFGLTLSDPLTEPFAYLGEKLSQQIQIEATMMGMTPQEYMQYLNAGGERPADAPKLGEGGVWEFPTEEGRAAAEAGPSASPDVGAVAGQIGDVFSALTPEQLDELGVEGIGEKFGLQRLALEEPEAFLQAMFDKAGVVPSPPIYGFLRDLVPSMVLLASTREGQDILKSPGGAVELNRVINQVVTEGFPSRESVIAGIEGMGGFARQFLTGGYEDPRSRFSFVMSTLDRLLGPTMSEPLRGALFSRQAATVQGDRFLSAAARGVFEGDFIDWLRKEGYPIPELPAYQPEAGAKFVAEEGGLAPGVSSSGAPAFVVKEGIYE